MKCHSIWTKGASKKGVEQETVQQKLSCVAKGWPHQSGLVVPSENPVLWDLEMDPELPSLREGKLGQD
jgi:hypothetical protein